MTFKSLNHDGREYGLTLIALALGLLSTLAISLIALQHRELSVAASRILELIVVGIATLDGVLMVHWAVEYLRRRIFAGERERIDRLITRWSRGEKQRALWVKLSDEEALIAIEKIARELASIDTLWPEIRPVAVGLAFCVARVVMGFTLATTSLILIGAVQCPSVAAFGEWIPRVETICSVAAIVERSFYANLVTLATVGFGDYAPKLLGSRVMVDAEIICGAVLLLCCLNVSLGMVMENSALAWAGRRQAVVDLLVDSADSERALNGAPPIAKRTSC